MPEALAEQLKVPVAGEAARHVAAQPLIYSNAATTMSNTSSGVLLGSTR